MIKEKEITIHKSWLRDFVRDKLLNSSSASMDLGISDNAVGEKSDRYEIIKEENEMLTLKLYLYYPKK